MLIIHMKLSISMILPMLIHVIDFFLANDRDLLVGDPHELPFPEGSLRLEICDKHLRGSFLRVERLGVPI